MSALTLSVMAVDGDVANEELYLMMYTLQRMQLFRSYPEEMIAKMLNKVLGLLNRRGFKKVIDQQLNHCLIIYMKLLLQ